MAIDYNNNRQRSEKAVSVKIGGDSSCHQKT